MNLKPSRFECPVIFSPPAPKASLFVLLGFSNVKRSLFFLLPFNTQILFGIDFRAEVKLVSSHMPTSLDWLWLTGAFRRVRKLFIS